MTDFPRGWTLATQASAGAAASITVPAVPGVVHVLDSITAKAQAGGAGAALECSIVLSSSDGVFNNFPIGAVSIPGANNSDEASASGLDLAAGPGASLTVAYNVATPAGDAETLIIQGRDI